MLIQVKIVINFYLQNASAGRTKRKRDIHFQLEDEYAPLFKRTVERDDAIRYRMQQERNAGKKNVDLWMDGCIYPPDPLTQRPPQFNGLTSFVKFVCEGNEGLYGYTCRLATQGLAGVHESLRNMQTRLQGYVQSLMEKDRLLAEKGRENQSLQQAMSVIEDAMHAVQVQNMELQSKIMELEKENRNIKSKLIKTLEIGPTVKTREARQRNRIVKPIHQLTKGGGQYHRRIYAQSATMKNMFPHAENDTIAKVLSKDMVKNALDNRKFRDIVDSVTSERLSDVSNLFTATDAQGLCDKVGMSSESYSMLYQQLDVGFKQVFKTKRVVPLPKPFHVKKARKQLNDKVLELIGEPTHLEHTHILKYGSKEVPFVLNASNNFVLDICRVQMAMVMFYNMSMDECRGKLQFVLKLDESEIIKGQKLERVSITLMNRALDLDINENHPSYFSVQSENEIWWLAAFEVPKEDHEVLKVFFNLTNTPSVIRQQNNGATLHVEGFGDYQVDWHLAGDLKTLKCMFGLSNAANAKFPCIYCMQTRKKGKDGKKEWIAKTGQQAAPTRDQKVMKNGVLVPVDPNWHPILEIPLTRVHFCTLHCMVRIIEKLVYEYVCFAYKMHPVSEADATCKKVEEVLSEVGLHGGQVEIKKDEKKSGKSGNIPCKPCFGGPKARKFLSPPRDEEGNILVKQPEKYEAWKKLHIAVPDRSNGGRTRIAKAEVWIHLDRLAPLLQKLRFRDGDANIFKETVAKFHNSMVEAWTSNSITHYMVSIVTITKKYNHCKLVCVSNLSFLCSIYSRHMVHTLQIKGV